MIYQRIFYEKSHQALLIQMILSVQIFAQTPRTSISGTFVMLLKGGWAGDVNRINWYLPEAHLF
jgi:hypothetical protein